MSSPTFLVIWNMAFCRLKNGVLHVHLKLLQTEKWYNYMLVGLQIASFYHVRHFIRNLLSGLFSSRIIIINLATNHYSTVIGKFQTYPWCWSCFPSLSCTVRVSYKGMTTCIAPRSFLPVRSPNTLEKFKWIRLQ